MAENPTDIGSAYSADSYAVRSDKKKSIYHDDGRIFHRPEFDYLAVERAVEVRQSGSELRCELELTDGSRVPLWLRLVEERVLRFQFGGESPRFDLDSPMLTEKAKGCTSLSVRPMDGSWEVLAGNHLITISKDPFGLKVTKSGARVFELETEKVAGDYAIAPLAFRSDGERIQTCLSWRIANDERMFGLGEKWNSIEKRQTRATVWASDTAGTNTTDLSYKSIPLIYSSKGWGLLVHSSFRSYWEIGSFCYTGGSVCLEEPVLEGFLFFGGSLKELLSTYCSLTGKPEMPPLWALGIWMSRCAYSSAREVDEVANRLRQERIPCDVIHIDGWLKNHYYQAIGVDACDFDLDLENFPDPEGFFKRNLDKGFNISLWMNPYLPEGHPIYDEAKDKGYMLRDGQGAIARAEFGEPIGVVDFTNPEAKSWWKGKVSHLLRQGASTVKVDYGDRVAEESIASNGLPGLGYHNLHMHLYSEACFEAVSEVRGESIVWRRSGYVGTQRYPGTWAGDTQVSWEALRCCLRGGLNAGLSGEAFWSSDIGGFVGPKPSDELYIRWAQFGLLSGLARFHGTTPREPWNYSREAQGIVAAYANLRYSLAPYLDMCAYEAAETGLPLMRAMVLEFPGEPNIETVEDQYMLGPFLLVAPILNEGQRERWVYFPKGDWFPLDGGSRISGPGFVRVSAPLDWMPLYARSDAVLPRFMHLPQHLKGDPVAVVRLEIYPDAKDRTIRFRNMSMPVEIELRGSCEATVRQGEVDLDLMWIDDETGSDWAREE